MSASHRLGPLVCHALTQRRFVHIEVRVLTCYGTIHNAPLEAYARLPLFRGLSANAPGRTRTCTVPIINGYLLVPSVAFPEMSRGDQLINASKCSQLSILASTNSATGATIHLSNQRGPPCPQSHCRAHVRVFTEKREGGLWIPALGFRAKRKLATTRRPLMYCLDVVDSCHIECHYIIEFCAVNKNLGRSQDYPSYYRPGVATC